jgi:hypothetical protein
MESSTDTLVIDFTNSELETIQEVSESCTPKSQSSQPSTPEPVPDVSNPVPDVTLQVTETIDEVSKTIDEVAETIDEVAETIDEVAEVPYDTTLVPRLYTELSMMLQGTSFSDVNWVILLTKTMSIVSQVKGLDKKAKVALSVDLVIKYLDEKTSLSDETLVIIKGSVLEMCMNILDGQSILKGTKKEPVSSDPTLRTSPQQIVSLLVTVIENSTNTWSLNTLVSQSTGIILTCITIVEKFQHITGIEKREVIISAINKLVETKFRPKLTPGSAEEVSINLLLASLPVMIDTLVAVGKGKPAFKFDFQDPATQTCLLGTLGMQFKLCKK